MNAKPVVILQFSQLLSMKLASVNPLLYDFEMDCDAFMARPEVINKVLEKDFILVCYYLVQALTTMSMIKADEDLCHWHEYVEIK